MKSNTKKYYWVRINGVKLLKSKNEIDIMIENETSHKILSKATYNEIKNLN